jgi:hypothetical protein
LLAALRVFCPVLNLPAKDIAVKLIGFDVDRWHVSDRGIMESRALLAHRFKDVQNSFFVKAGQTAGGADADALTKQPHNLINLLGFDSQAVQRLRFRKRLAATNTAKPAHNPVFILEFGEIL